MSVPRNLPASLGELRRSTFSEERLRSRRVKDELRENLIGPNVGLLRGRLSGGLDPASAAIITSSEDEGGQF